MKKVLTILLLVTPNKLFLLFLFLAETAAGMQQDQQSTLYKTPCLAVLQKRLQDKGFGKLANHQEIQDLADRNVPMAIISASVNYAVFNPDIYFGKREKEERAVYESIFEDNPQALTKILFHTYLE